VCWYIQMHYFTYLYTTPMVSMHICLCAGTYRCTTSHINIPRAIDTYLHATTTISIQYIHVCVCVLGTSVLCFSVFNWVLVLTQ